MTDTLHIYTRVSSIVQETQGTSLQSQEELGIVKAQELGFGYRLWNEGGRSSRFEDLHNRPVLRKLMLEIEEGRVAHLFVFNTDRLSRNQKTWGGIRWKLKQHNVRLYTPSGVISLSSPMDDLVLGILSEISQYDNALRSERSQIGKLKKVQSGYWHGGPPPFGYRIQDGVLIENQDESKWIKRIYDRYLNGVPIVKIKAELETNNVEPRRKGNTWSLGSIQKILRNTFYYGRYSYRDKKLNETVECHCPAFITEAMWHRAQDKRKNTLKRKGQINKTKHFYMLRDFMFCAHCSGFMSARKCNGNREQHYYCASNESNWKINPPEDTQKWKRGKGCNMTKALNVLRTDEIVWDAIMKTLSDPAELHDQLSAQIGIDGAYRKRRTAIRKQIQDFETQLTALDSSLVDIETDYRMGKVAERIYDRVADNLNTERQSVLERLEQASMRYYQLNNEGQWVSKVQSLVVDIDHIQTFNKRKKRNWLSRIVDRIDVRYLHDPRNMRFLWL